MDDQTVDSAGTWLCEHEPPAPPTCLSEADARETPPHYVVCPDCGTYWIVWRDHLVENSPVKMAKPVIIPYIVTEGEP